MRTQVKADIKRSIGFIQVAQLIEDTAFFVLATAGGISYDVKVYGYVLDGAPVRNDLAAFSLRNVLFQAIDVLPLICGGRTATAVRGLSFCEINDGETKRQGNRYFLHYNNFLLLVD